MYTFDKLAILSGYAQTVSMHNSSPTWQEEEKNGIRLQLMYHTPDTLHYLFNVQQPLEQTKSDSGG